MDVFVHRYIVSELCGDSLETLCNHSSEYVGPALPTDAAVLYQIACGLDYVHSMNVVHHNLKPSNILISKSHPVVIKIVDFAQSKYMSVWKERKLEMLNWRAPECILSHGKLGQRGTVKSDIFSAGMVFFYFLTKGIHPFGNLVGDDFFNVAQNICGNNAINFASEYFMKTDLLQYLVYIFIQCNCNNIHNL